MISFDVVSLFTNVPLNKTIDIILRKVYDEKKIKTKIKKCDMRNLLYLCTKDVPFMFNGELYLQIDGVMMGSPLGALFANIFMCELENSLIPTIPELKRWSRYVDDTFAFIKTGKEEHVLEKLNGFHQDIKFTYEYEEAGTIAFLDVLVRRNDDNKLETSVYRKSTNTDIYMNWNSYAPKSWKIATLRSLIKRAFLVSSQSEYLKTELDHLKHVFTNYNDYPKQLVDQIMKEEKEICTSDKADTKTTNADDESDVVTLCLPYMGGNGENILNKMRRTFKQLLKNKVELQIVYTGKKLGEIFTVKDKTENRHQHNVVYYAECPNKKCNSRYIGETKRRLEVRTVDHNKRDKKSHLLQHSVNSRHKRVWIDDFKIIGSGYKSDFKRRISEALFIRKFNPDLNKQKDAYRLSLFL